MWHLATAHAQTLHSGWAYNRVKIPSCKNFEAKEGMGVYSRWAYFREGTVQGFWMYQESVIKERRSVTLHQMYRKMISIW